MLGHMSEYFSDFWKFILSSIRCTIQNFQTCDRFCYSLYVGMPLPTDLEDWAIGEGIFSDCSSRSCSSTTVKSTEIADHEYQGALDDWKNAAHPHPWTCSASPWSASYYSPLPSLLSSLTGRRSSLSWRLRSTSTISRTWSLFMSWRQHQIQKVQMLPLHLLSAEHFPIAGWVIYRSVYGSWW